MSGNVGEGSRREVRDVGWLLVFQGGWFHGFRDRHRVGDTGEEVLRARISLVVMEAAMVSVGWE